MTALSLPIRWSEMQVLDHSTDKDQSDDRLIAGAAEGDHRAFSVLVARHADRLRAIAIRFTGNEADAEDIVQETFWRAWRKIESWETDGDAQFSTWLYHTLINQCIDRDRKRRVRAWFNQALGKQDTGSAPDDQPGADRVAEARQTLERVCADIRELPPRQRAALLLSVLDGRANREIGEILGSSVGAVEQALVRARRTLRDRMQARQKSDMGLGLER